MGHKASFDACEKVNFPKIHISIKEAVLLCFIAAASLFLLFYNLDNQYLWQDEAQTALISKTILTNGIPMASDGLNSFSQEWGRDYEKQTGIFKWHPWASYYVTALSFKTLGITTFSARFPHALFALFSVFLLYFFVRSNTGSMNAAFIAAWLLLCSPAFLVMARQCRYYSMVMFFSLLCLNEYMAGYNGTRKSFIGLAISLVFLYYTQSVYALITGAVVIFHALLYKRDSVVRLLIALAAAGLICLPWLIYSRSADYKAVYPGIMTFKSLIKYVPEYLSQSLLYIYSIGAAFFLGLVNLNRKVGAGMSAQTPLIGLGVLFYLLMITGLSFFSVHPFFRYLAPLLIVAPAMSAVLFNSLLKARYVNVAAILLLIVPVLLMKDYVYEITHDFNSPSKGMVGFLKDKAKPGDTVAITYGDMPLKFYLDNIRIAGGLTGEDLAGAKNARFVIFRKYTVARDREVAAYLTANLDIKNYIPRVIDSPDTAFDNREDPSLHLYKTADSEDKVIIWEKK